MLHLPDNIKIIRKLLGQTQETFIKNFTGISLAMQKSYEGRKATPGLMYLKELSELAGVSVQDLDSKSLSRKDLKLKVEKVESADISNEPNSLNKQSLERSIENLTQNELRTTAIIERLVTLLEKQYGGTGPTLTPPGTPGTETMNPRKQKEKKV